MGRGHHNPIVCGLSTVSCQITSSHSRVSLDFDADAFAKTKRELDIKCRHVFDGRSVGGSITKHFKVDHMPLDIVIDSTGHFLGMELTLEFCVPAGPPLLKRYRMEPSWPTRDSGAAQ